MSFTSVNIWAVLVAAAFNMILGSLWYSRILFGTLWMKLIGKTEEDLGGAAGAYVASILSGLVASYVLAIVVRMSGATTFFAGLLVGVVLWIGIGSTATLVVSVFNGPSVKAWLLHACYQLIVFAAAGGLFAIWR